MPLCGEWCLLTADFADFRRSFGDVFGGQVVLTIVGGGVRLMLLVMKHLFWRSENGS